jgi:hypothetical protein
MSTKKSGRCWEGYKPTPGKKPYDKGSCTKSTTTKKTPKKSPPKK